MNSNDRFVVRVCAGVTLAVLCLAGFVVAMLANGNAMVIAAVFTALATVLAAVPPIIRAIHGNDRQRDGGGHES